jgi:hypothetical protein
MADPNDKPATAARLRADIDSGEGRDKVDYPDPAAAPLGTDDEAAGTPISADQVRRARENEHRYDEATDRDTDRNNNAPGSVRVPGVDSTHPGAQPDPKIAPSRPSNVGMAVVAVLALVALAVLIAVYP